nr:DUF262 domain-containing protein [uncultured Brevundimonas sp.]
MTDLSSQPTPLQTIYGWYRGGSLIVNRNYQRKLVWTLHEKQQLVDSILRDYPIPLVLLAETTNDSGVSLEIMDGLQRLHTIVSFIEHGFPLADGRYFNVDEFTRAKEERENGTFIESESKERISRTEVSKILDYILPVSVIRHADANVVTEVFGRINSYGHRLSDQERRQAGLISEFSKFVRTFSSELRGDVSVDRLPLYQMPEISVDLSTTKYGYKVQASDVFWVRQGILRSTELRDSVDEQVVADLAACVLNGEPIERSKETLDQIYQEGGEVSAKMNAALSHYGAERLGAELKFCIELIDKITAAGGGRTLRDLVFPNKTSNSFPTVFSAILLAVHDIVFNHQTVLAHPKGAYDALHDVQGRLDSSRRALSPANRRANINVIKGLIQDQFAPGDVSKIAYGGKREVDIINGIRRSAIETPRFELKQGMLSLSDARQIDDNLITKVIKTAVAIANIGPAHGGTIFIGVADKPADAERIRQLDNVEPIDVGGRWVVGVDREAAKLGISLETYFQRWRDGIGNAALSEPLKSSLLANLDLCEFKGVHILIITVPPQPSVSFLADDAFIREGNDTIRVNAQKLLAIADRFR